MSQKKTDTVIALFGAITVIGSVYLMYTFGLDVLNVY